MKNMVKWTGLLAIAAAALFSLSTARAADHSFTFSIGANETLVINAPDGSQVATLPTATVSKTVTSGAYSFQISFGQDANGNLSLIVTPDPDHPNSISFTMNGRDVSMDRTSAVTLTLTNGGRDVVVDPGYTGAVKVNGQTVTTPVVTNTTATGTVVVPIGNTGNGTTTTTTTTNTNGTTTTVASNTGNTPPPVPGPASQQTEQTPGSGTDAGLSFSDPLSSTTATLAQSDVRTNPSALTGNTVDPTVSPQDTTKF